MIRWGGKGAHADEIPKDGEERREEVEAQQRSGCPTHKFRYCTYATIQKQFKHSPVAQRVKCQDFWQAKQKGKEPSQGKEGRRQVELRDGKVEGEKNN